MSNRFLHIQSHLNHQTILTTFQEKGKIAAAAEFHERLIRCYNDQPDTLSLANFIEALENQKTNVKLVEMLNSAVESPSQSGTPPSTRPQKHKVLP